MSTIPVEFEILEYPYYTLKEPINERYLESYTVEIYSSFHDFLLKRSGALIFNKGKIVYTLQAEDSESLYPIYVHNIDGTLKLY